MEQDLMKLATRDKIKVNVKFKTEAYFDAVVELRLPNLQRLQKFIGNNNLILGGEDGAEQWIKLLVYNCEFDYILKNQIDIEEIEIIKLDYWPQPQQ